MREYSGKIIGDRLYKLGGEPPEEEGEIRVRGAALALVLTGVLGEGTAREELAGSHAGVL